MLKRDVINMTNYYGQFCPALKQSKYADEMWALFEAGELTPESELTGLFKEDTASADVDTVLEEIKAAFEEEEARIARIGEANAVDSEF